MARSCSPSQRLEHTPSPHRRRSSLPSRLICCLRRALRTLPGQSSPRLIVRSSPSSSLSTSASASCLCLLLQPLCLILSASLSGVSPFPYLQITVGRYIAAAVPFAKNKAIESHLKQHVSTAPCSAYKLLLETITNEKGPYEAFSLVSF